MSIRFKLNRKDSRPVISGLAIFLILNFCSIWIIHTVKSGVTNNTLQQLKTVQLAVHEALHYWRDANLVNIISIANRQNIKKLVVDLVDAAETKNVLQRNKTLTRLRGELKHYINDNGYAGFFVVNRRKVSIGSMRDNNMDTQNLVAIQDPDSLLRGFAGETLLSKPLLSDVPLEDEHGNLQPNQYSLFSITPVTNQKNRIVALLMFRIPPKDHFNRILSVGRTGKSGETYLINEKGVLLSSSRFEAKLIQAGLVKPGTSSAYQFVVREPAGNINKRFRPTDSYSSRPLIEIVRTMMQSNTQTALTSSLDYRGVNVVSIGEWDHAEGWGYVTQIDHAEAYAIYDTIRMMIAWTTIMAAALLLYLVAFLIRSRQNAIKLVNKRTQQLKNQNQSLLSTIEEHSRAENNLRDSQLKTTAILQSAFDAIIATDENGNIELTNSSAEEIFGYEKDELIGKNVRILMPDNIGKKHDDLIRLHNTGVTSTIVGRRREMVAARKDGSSFPIELAVEETLINDHKFFVSTINDITKRKEMIERVSSSEEKYRAIINNLSDTFYRTDKDGKLVMVSPSVAQLLGYRTEEATELNMASLYVNPHGHDKLIKVLEKGDGSINDYETQFIRKDGIAIWVSNNAHFYIDEYGNPLGIEGTLRDITSRKRYEEELRESRQRLSFHMKQTPLGVIEWDIDFKVIEWNPAAEKIFGYSRNEAIGRHARDLIIPDEYKPHVDDIWYSLLGQRGGQHSTNQNINKEGKKIWCEWYNTPLVNENMEVFGVASMVMDVTTRKKAEEILTRDHEQLETLVEIRTDELNNARLDAEHANEAKSEFLANMSHELRTPMHTILSFAEMGMKKADKLSKEKLIQYFTNIHQGGQRQMSLLNDLLDLSKLESGNTVYEFSEHDLKDIIEDQLTQHELMLDKKNIQIEFEPGPVDSHFSFDRLRIEQVVRNLLSNAIKFSKENTCISIQFALSEIHHEHDSMPALLVSVSDQGVGIPKNELDLVFDKFAQSSKTRSKAGGTGLGLAICQEIIAAHGGKIWAENNAKGGARFCFTLPIIHNEHSISIKRSQLGGNPA